MFEIAGVEMFQTSQALKSFLTNRGVLFTHWGEIGATKPFSRLWSALQAGEIELFDAPDGSVAYRTQKSCVVILRKRSSRGMQMLFEHKRFSNGTEVAPRQDYSVSEKCRFLLGESPREAVVRGIAEELGLHGVDASEFVEFGQKESPLHASNAFPGLLASSTKTLFEWVMPKPFQKAQYVEHCGYRTSTFVFDRAPASVLHAHEARKMKRKVA